MATIGFSAKLEIGTGADDALEQLDETVTITVPELEASSVESTHLNVTNRVRTYVPGLLEPGGFGFECNYSAARYAKLKAIVGVSKPFKVSSPTDEDQTFSFNGHITKLSLMFEGDKLTSIKADCKNEGEVTLGTIT